MINGHTGGVAYDIVNVLQKTLDRKWMNINISFISLIVEMMVLQGYNTEYFWQFQHKNVCSTAALNISVDLS